MNKKKELNEALKPMHEWAEQLEGKGGLDEVVKNEEDAKQLADMLNDSLDEVIANLKNMVEGNGGQNND